MAKKNRNEVAVGITVLVALVLGIYVIVLLGDWGELFVAKQEITVRLPYRMGLKGLTAGSPVYLGGAKIGSIGAAGIDKTEGKESPGRDIYVRFVMSIPVRYELRTDCILAAESNLLGGEFSLAVKDLGSTGRVIEDGETVTLALEGSIADTMDSIKRELDASVPESLMHQLKYELSRTNADSLMRSLTTTAANLKGITERIDQQLLMDDEKQSLLSKVHVVLGRLDNITEQINAQLASDGDEAVVARLHAVLEKMDRSMAEIEQLVAVNKGGITEMVTSLKNTAGELEKDLPAIAQQLKETLEKANGAVDAAQSALKDIQALAANAENTLGVNRERIDLLIANLHETSTNLKITSRDVRRAPWKLLYKPKKGEVHLAGVIDSAGNFAVAAERLDSSVVGLRAVTKRAGEKMGVDKEQLAETIAELEASLARFEQAEDKFWEELKATSKKK